MAFEQPFKDSSALNLNRFWTKYFENDTTDFIYSFFVNDQNILVADIQNFVSTNSNTEEIRLKNENPRKSERTPPSWDIIPVHS